MNGRATMWGVFKAYGFFFYFIEIVCFDLTLYITEAEIVETFPCVVCVIKFLDPEIYRLKIAFLIFHITCLTNFM